MSAYLLSTLIATVMLISLYVLSLREYPVELKFDLPNQVAEYKVPTKPLDNKQPFSITLKLRTALSLGGICLFNIGGYTVDLRVQNAKVVLICKVTSLKQIKLTLQSKVNLYEGWNDLQVLCTTDPSTTSVPATLKIIINLNGQVSTGTIQNVKGLPFTISKVNFGHLNFKGCLKDLYFNGDMVRESNLLLINVFKGCL